MVSPALKVLLLSENAMYSELVAIRMYGLRFKLSELLDAMEMTTSAEPFLVLSAYFTTILNEPVFSGVPESVPLENPLRNDGIFSKEKVPLTSPLAWNRTV